MPSDASSSQPLLPSAVHPTNGTNSKSPEPASETIAQKTTRYKAVYHFCKGEVRAFLSSRAQHYTVLALVSFDLLGIFADIIINLYQCDEKDTDPIWDDVRNGLGTAGLVFSLMFLLELLLSIWAFGWMFVCSFHGVLFHLTVLSISAPRYWFAREKFYLKFSIF